MDQVRNDPRAPSVSAESSADHGLTRRTFIRGGALLAGAAAVGAFGAGGMLGAPPASAVTADEATASTGPELIFTDPEFAFELRRTMSATYAGEADLG